MLIKYKILTLAKIRELIQQVEQYNNHPNLMEVENFFVEVIAQKEKIIKEVAEILNNGITKKEKTLIYK